MASPKLSITLCFLTIWATAVLAHGGSHSQKAAQAPAVDCSNLILTMSDCLTFVENGSTINKPEPNCCSGLKSILKTAPKCLCEAFNSAAQFGVVLNVTKATSLPAACKVSAPSVSNCGLSLTPASAPAGVLSPQSSPASSATSPTSDAAAAAPGDSGDSSVPVNGVAPTPSPSSTASSLFPISAGSLLVCLLVAATSSAF